MKRFKNILVVPAEPRTDDPALKRAARLAETNVGRLTVLWPIQEDEVDGNGSDLLNEIVREAEAELRSALEPYRKQGLTADVRVRTGREFIEIIRQVKEGKHDLVLKTARGRKLFHNMFFGTTALHLLRKCPCPVWIVGPEPGDRAGVLAAVDPDTEDAGVQALNEKMMEMATSLALLEHTDLHVVHSWAVPHEDALRHSPFLRVTRSGADGYIKDIETRHRERFAALTDKFRNRFPNMRTHFVKGLAGDAIPEVARANNIEVIVMATLSKAGVPGLLISDTAETVLSQVECSVLAIKPEGFVSPVTL